MLLIVIGSLVDIDTSIGARRAILCSRGTMIRSILTANLISTVVRQFIDCVRGTCHDLVLVASMTAATG